MRRGRSSKANKLVRAGGSAGPPGDEIDARDGGAVDEELVDRAVRDLRGIVVGGQIDLVAEVGQYILKNFYDGSLEEARARRPYKAASLRRLAERADEFGMTASGVRNAVPLSLQVHALGVVLARRLPMTHHLAILPLRNPAEKRLLAEAAVANAWTVRDLRRERGHLQEPHAGGRPAEPALRVAVARAARRVLDDKPAATELRRGLDGIGAKEAQGLLRKVNAMQREMERWEKLLVEAVARAGGKAG